MIKNVQKRVNGVNISVEPKIELMGILITLSDESSIDRFKRLFEFGDNNDEYVNMIKKEFSYLYETGLIDRFNKIKDKYRLHYQEPIKLVLMLDDEFDHKSLEAYCYEKPEQDFYDFVSELKELYESPKFIDFFNNNRERYSNWVDSLAPFYEKYNILDAISTYCGDNYRNLELYSNLIAFETNGGYGIYLEDGAHYCNRASSSQYTVDNNLFASQNIDFKLKIVIHEFLHGIINPLTDKYKIFTHDSDYLEKTDSLRFSGYGTDYSLANETIVRAITIKICSNIIKEIDPETLLNSENERGFVCIKDVYNMLSEYENNRGVYNNIDSFYEKIATTIVNKKSKDQSMKSK